MPRGSTLSTQSAIRRHRRIVHGVGANAPWDWGHLRRIGPGGCLRPIHGVNATSMATLGFGRRTARGPQPLRHSGEESAQCVSTRIAEYASSVSITLKRRSRGVEPPPSTSRMESLAASAYAIGADEIQGWMEGADPADECRLAGWIPGEAGMRNRASKGAPFRPRTALSTVADSERTGERWPATRNKAYLWNGSRLQLLCSCSL